MSQPVWTLVIQQGPHAGSVFPLHGQTMTIGRSADNQIVIDHPEVSRHHARLSWQGNTYMLEDLGSANGTWVNGTRIAGPTLLRPGDSIGLGQGLALTFSSRAQATSLAPYPSTFASPVVASATAPARTNWKWVVAALGALILVAAMAVVAVVILAPGKDDSSTAISTGSDQGAVVVITATPSPTYTPVPTDPPTYTPYPTYTPVPTDPPTYTPYPTYTAVPTDPPTYTPYPTYTPVPTDPPTYTPYPTYTPFPTPRPQPAQPRPTDTPNPTRAPEPPYTIDINKIEPEPWGRPMNPDGCNKPYNDRDPVRRLTIEVILTNNSNRYVPDGWAPTFYTAKGQVPPTCIWWYDNTAVQPGEVTYVTFATHVESDDWVRAMVFDELGYEIMICFNAAAQVVACR